MTGQRILWLTCFSICLAALVFAYQSWRLSTQAAILIQWNTAGELDAAGFNLFRSESPEGTFVPVNANLIPAELDLQTGGSYEYVDQNVEPGLTYYYQLEEFETGVRSTQSDLVAVKAVREGRQEFVISLVLAALGILGLMLTVFVWGDKSVPAGTGT